MLGEVDCFRRALVLARRGEGHTRPNPPVGAVIVKNGRIIGEGYHHKAGTNHAETAAIADARRRGHSTAGATIFVTLEPCSRPGRVGACTDAIAAAGLKRVLFALPDPNPTNRGRARRVLARAGIDCALFRGDASITAEAERLIAPFAKHIRTGLPFVTVKLAMSLDGQISDLRGDAKWISSAKSRRVTGLYRTRVDAIMVGAETVRRDDPLLLSHGKRNNDLIRVVISRSGKLPRTARVFTEGPNETLVFKDPQTALAELGKRGCLHVLCEGGLRLARALADAGLVDAWHLVTAPIVIGSRPIGEALRFSVAECGYSDEKAGDRATLYVRNQNLHE